MTDTEFIAQFEGSHLTAYQDEHGIWTIGHGHTGPEVHAGMTITPEEEQRLFSEDLQQARAAVSRLLRIPITSNMRTALTSLVYNIGVGAFEHSTLLKALNDARYDLAASYFAGGAVSSSGSGQGWVFAGTPVPSLGLLRRRLAEAALFRTP